MILHFIKDKNGNITYSNWPIKENDLVSIPFEVSEEDKLAVEEGIKEWLIEDGKLLTKDSNKKAEREEFEAQQKEIEDTKREELEILKKKLEKGSASTAEIQLALSKLI
jgi:hypothetical protein